MLRNSFILLDGIAHPTEHHLWQQGITDWHAFLTTPSITGITSKRKHYYNTQLKHYHQSLITNNLTAFHDAITHKDTWRLYPTFKSQAVFLDIETTGLTRHDQVTMVGLYDGFDTKIMIAGINLDWRHLQQELSTYELIVTFNGASFDLPFITQRHPNVLPSIPHLDLRHACKQLGLTGGLKHIEKQLGITRPDQVEGFSGGDAVTLWRMYKNSGDTHYLNLLIKYNEEDIINLKQLATYTTHQLIHRNLHPHTGCNCPPKLIKQPNSSQP